MNQQIQNIADKVSQNIAAKATATPDPARVSAAKHAEILNDVLAVVDDLVTTAGTPPNPTGVEWIETPTVDVDGDTIDVSEGIVSISGTPKTILAETITEPLPAVGYKRPCSVVADYQATPGAFTVISGETVGENESYAFPPVPAGYLWVANFMVTNAGVTQAPTGAINTIVINGVTYVADATGKAVLPTTTPTPFNVTYAELTGGQSFELPEGGAFQIIYNGTVPLRKGEDYTVSGTTVTLAEPVDTSIPGTIWGQDFKTVPAIGAPGGNYTDADAVAALEPTITPLATRVEELEEGTERTESSYPSRNLFDKAAVVTGQYINAANGSIISYTGKISGRIPVLPGTIYTLSGYINPAPTTYHAIRFENSANALISYATINSVSPYTFTTPANCAYVIFGVYRDNAPQSYDLVQLEQGASATAFQSFGGIAIVEKIANAPLLASYVQTEVGVKTIKEYVESKNYAVKASVEAIRVVAFGDSITANASNWTQTLISRVPGVTVTNMALSGARIAWAADTVEAATPQANTPPNNVFWNQIKKWQATTPPAPDAFIIALGTNDVSQSSTIGTMADAFAQDLASTSQLTMANALRKGLQLLIDTYPAAQIFICTPLQSKTGGRTWSNLNNVSNVLVDVAKRLNVKVIDCFNKSGIIDEYEPVGAAGRYLSDGTHPTSAGAAKQGQLIAKEFVKEYIYKN